MRSLILRSLLLFSLAMPVPLVAQNSKENHWRRLTKMEDIIAEQDSVSARMRREAQLVPERQDRLSYDVGAIPFEEGMSPSGARIYSVPIVQSDMGISGYTLATAKGKVLFQPHTTSGRVQYFSALYPDGSTATFGFTDLSGPKTTYPITSWTDTPYLFLGRGFTGHEHLTWFGLVNMNARLYDPLLGRFLSPDPYVQAPDFTQNFNRYSYALNNPLRYTDESGEFVVTTAMIVGAAIGFTVGMASGYMIGTQHGAKGWGMVGYVICGGLIGGLSGGIASVKDGKRFIDGASVQKFIREQDIPVIGQRGDNNCVPASIEAVDKSFGGEMTQEQMRSLIGGNPNIDPVEDLSAWSKYFSETGHSLSGEHGITNGSQFRMFSQIGLDNRVVINLNYGGNVGHSVVV